ncbi:MAG TPA: hypothetical protein VGO50_13955 [Pyrinomonadaceae bacterium]|jgi:hypothetical protein|nr:hypothetical protein [Pyrinomonadaceae bacterium]
MIKKIIQICSLLVLFTTFSVISAASANAQVNNQIDAKIPFAFTFGENSYPAGDYVIKMQKTGDAVVNLLLEDKQGVQLDRVMATENGRTSANDPALEFDLQSEQRSLTRLAFSDRGYSLYKSNSGRQNLSKNKASKVTERSVL